MAKASLLIGDIGGTNARFAIADAKTPGFTLEHTQKCSDYATAEDAITHYLDVVGAAAPTAICLAAAGPIVDERVRFTNNPWIIEAGALRKSFATERVRLLNDFEAIAYCIPFLGKDDAVTVGLPEPEPLDDNSYTVGVVGPGTGLGAVGLVKHDGRYLPISGEASHGGFAPESQVQIDVLGYLRERFERVSSERLVSGPGIENLYWALCRIHKEKRAALTAPEIFAAAVAGEDPRASEAVELFFEVLGQFAGDYALAIGGFDGIYIAGGITKRYPDKLANSRFRNGFERKGRHRSLMERIPTHLITHDQPGLLGAAYCAVQLTGKR